MKIKICGITKLNEAEYLNEAGADYAGFVFYEKSKRNISVEKAKEIFEVLNPNIKKVAVTVSPTLEQVLKLQESGFDIIQIHKQLTEEVLDAVKIPVWYAVNIADTEKLLAASQFINELKADASRKITAIVVDAENFGSGQTFNWHKSKRMLKAGAQSPPGFEIFEERDFILAGGLTPRNVQEGIRIFSPDAVDVSSGVEGEEGKDREKILKFASEARRLAN